MWFSLAMFHTWSTFVSSSSLPWHLDHRLCLIFRTLRKIPFENVRWKSTWRMGKAHKPLYRYLLMQNYQSWSKLLCVSIWRLCFGELIGICVCWMNLWIYIVHIISTKSCETSLIVLCSLPSPSVVEQQCQRQTLVPVIGNIPFQTQGFSISILWFFCLFRSQLLFEYLYQGEPVGNSHKSCWRRL